MAAWLALQMLGGDLGGGFFAGVQPALQWSPWAALTFGLLGVAATLAGAWWPARSAMDLPPAATLKGLGSTHEAAPRTGLHWYCLLPVWLWPFMPPSLAFAGGYISCGLAAAWRHGRPAMVAGRGAGD